MDLKLNKLTPKESEIIQNKGTEHPFSGKYNDFNEEGMYICKQCNSPLYHSKNKFNSQCGWPSFDEEIANAVKKHPDADGRRTEILCANCNGHLGHVFKGENLTHKNTRHCVNSISMSFVSNQPDTSSPSALQSAYFAGGCFWGVEHLMQQQAGIESVVSGYMGGKLDNPSYEQVCTKKTGHFEVVKVNYDPNKIDYETLAKLFFEIHDPTQTDGQGPDIGSQYASAIFISNKSEERIINKLIDILTKNGFNIATQVLPICHFWEAEKYHQNYYEKNEKQPYCHKYEKKF